MTNTARHSYRFGKLLSNDSTQKIFCVSMQRTGTTSVGKFFRDFGFSWAGWPANRDNDWSGSWYEGDYERIFSSEDFRLANAYEDGPWFLPGFYKVLYHRFPEAKFILFTRDPDKWFQSMIKHSGGDVLGRSRIHCKVYRREPAYFDLLSAGLIDEVKENQIESVKTMKLIEHAEHYKMIYRLHNIEVKDFFHRRAPHALHIGSLDDPEKWPRVGEFLGIQVPGGYTSHENASVG